MSNSLSSLGIYGYDPKCDVKDLTAKQIAQMLWYFIDGKSRSKQEAALEDRSQFNEFNTHPRRCGYRFFTKSQNKSLVDAVAGQKLIALQLQ